jgi:hypothetical protein
MQQAYTATATAAAAAHPSQPPASSFASMYAPPTQPPAPGPTSAPGFSFMQVPYEGMDTSKPAPPSATLAMSNAQPTHAHTHTHAHAEISDWPARQHPPARGKDAEGPGAWQENPTGTDDPMRAPPAGWQPDGSSLSDRAREASQYHPEAAHVLGVEWGERPGTALTNITQGSLSESMTQVWRLLDSPAAPTPSPLAAPAASAALASQHSSQAQPRTKGGGASVESRDEANELLLSGSAPPIATRHSTSRHESRTTALGSRQAAPVSRQLRQPRNYNIPDP